MTAPAAPAPVSETLPEAIPAAAPEGSALAVTPPAAVAAAAVPEAPSATPPEARRPLSRKEAKAAAMQAIPEAASELATETPPAAPTAAEAAALGATPGEAPVAAEGAAPAAPAAPIPALPLAPKPILVHLPPVLREMGVEALSAASPQEERALRALINGYVRRQDVETLRSRNAELERGAAQREAQSAADQKWRASPAYKTASEKYQRLVELEGSGEIPAGTAEDFRASFDAQVAKLTQAELDERMAVISQQEETERGRAWASEAWANVNIMPEAVRSLPKFEGWFAEALETFDAKIERGHYDAVLSGLPVQERVPKMHQIFMKDFGASLTAKPEVVAIFASLNQREATEKAAATTKAAEEERRIAKIKLDAVEEFKRSLAKTVPPHPLGNLAPASAQNRVPAGHEAAAPAAPQGPQSPRKLAKAAAMERTREHLGI